MTIIKRGRLHITEEKKAYIEKYWGPIESLGDKEAQEIVQEDIADRIVDAEFDDNETIIYDYEAWDEDDDDEVAPAWTDEYLATLGMSKRDFF